MNFSVAVILTNLFITGAIKEEVIEEGDLENNQEGSEDELFEQSGQPASTASSRKRKEMSSEGSDIEVPPESPPKRGRGRGRGRGGRGRGNETTTSPKPKRGRGGGRGGRAAKNQVLQSDEENENLEPTPVRGRRGRGRAATPTRGRGKANASIQSAFKRQSQLSQKSNVMYASDSD